MTGTDNSNNMNKALFAELVMMLSSSAMQQMGKLVNPITRKAEVNLEAAQVTIDLLEMLRTKTHGNLDHDEDVMLAGVLSSLQMTFVETSGKQPPSRKEQDGEAAAESADAGEAAPPGEESSAPPTDPGKEPKFRKSYG